MPKVHPYSDPPIFLKVVVVLVVLVLVVVLVVVVVVLVVLVPRFIDIARLMQIVPMEAIAFQIRNSLSSKLWIAPTCKWSRVEHSPDALRTSTRR